MIETTPWSRRVFMPSARVWNEMMHEPNGFWPVPINGGDEFAFLLKAPMSVIKAAFRSCPISLSVSITATQFGSVISTVCSVADDPAAPFTISEFHRYAEEVRALEQVLLRRRAIFVFFDELSRPVLRAQCELDSTASDRARGILCGSEPKYFGKHDQVLEDVLDAVQGLVDPLLAVDSKYSPRMITVPMTLSGFQTAHIAAIGEQEVRQFRLEDVDEGYVLEHAAWHLMEHLFGRSIFHSPRVTDDSENRELTDIFAFCDNGLCFVEAKTAAILSTRLDRSTERRASSVRKQITKGLSQLTGAMRSVDRNLPLTRCDGEPIRLPPDARFPRHGIIMVSELLPSVDWSAVWQQLEDASSSTNSMFHVLDPAELSLLVSVSRNEPNQFLLQLTSRFLTVREHKSAFVRTRIKGPPLP